MTRIGVIADTHGYLDPLVFKYFEQCDQVWHAGDIGTIEVTEELKKRYDLRAVFGNIDGTELRKEFEEDLIFSVGTKKILITHIAGNPGSYPKRVTDLIAEHHPDVLVCGHSHILRVEFDKKYNLLYINPGAAGVHGFHKVKTLLRFAIDGEKITNMEVVEMGSRASLKKDPI